MSWNDFTYYIKETWERCQDGYFLLWNESLDKIKTFQTPINNKYPKIQFTTEQRYLRFLDILITKRITELENKYI